MIFTTMSFPNKTAVALIITLGLCACSESDAPPTTISAPALTNIAAHPIYLKDLSTGITFDAKKLPKPYLRVDEVRRLKYEYFGEPRDAEILLTKSNLIYFIKIDLGLFAAEVLKPLEEGFSQKAGKPVKFDCSTQATSLEPLGIKNSKLETTDCKIIHESQLLSVKIRKPLGVAAATRIDLHGGEITLVDKKLAGDAEREKRASEETANQKGKQKRQSDI